MSQTTESTPAPVLTGSVADALRRDIVETRLAPGTSVTEALLSERFGVSRSTARTAIERLVADGLLRREAHHAARVPRLDADELRDLYDARALIEGAAMRRLAAAGDMPAGALRAHRALLEAAHGDGAFAAQDIAFHRALVAAQPSARLTRMHDQLIGEIELAIGQVQAHRLMSPVAVAEQHERILAALVAGDGERAERLTREHIERARDALLAHTRSSAPSPTQEG